MAAELELELDVVGFQSSAEDEEELFHPSLELDGFSGQPELEVEEWTDGDVVGLDGSPHDEDEEVIFACELELDVVDFSGPQELALEEWEDEEDVGLDGPAEEEVELDDFQGPQVDVEGDGSLPQELLLLPTCEDDEAVVSCFSPQDEDEDGALFPIDTLVLTTVEVLVTDITDEEGPLVEVRVIVFTTVL